MKDLDIYLPIKSVDMLVTRSKISNSNMRHEAEQISLYVNVQQDTGHTETRQI